MKPLREPTRAELYPVVEMMARIQWNYPKALFDLSVDAIQLKRIRARAKWFVEDGH